MHLRHRLAVFVLLLLAVCSPAFGWNAVGHMAVAYSAYQQLTPAEKARVAVLLRKCPWYHTWLTYLPKTGLTRAQRAQYLFMMAATWPDEIKAAGSGYTGNDTPPAGEGPTLNDGYGKSSNHSKPAHKYWHFIDTPFSPDSTPLPAVPEPEIVEKITVFRAALATNETARLKSYDLVWLLHLVGDVHQPLHCTTRITAAKPKGDLGGNSVVLSDSSKELHAFWDSAVGTGQTKDFKKAETVGASLPAPDATLAADDNETRWAAESFALAQSAAYANPPIGPALGPYTPTPEYAANVRGVAKQRIALAGARLAHLLHEALGCTDSGCAH
jgi:hypothetical protein